jgi:transcriptional regulator with XRE-family HTH domain
VSELTEQLRQTFIDPEYRNAYAESFQNSYVAAQIKVLREDFPMTQGELAAKIGSKQPGIARLENVNYSSWKVETLRKIARALQVRLRITFEEFGTLPNDIEAFNKEALSRLPFNRDPVFLPCPAVPPISSSPLGTTGVEGPPIDGQIEDEEESFRKQPQSERLGGVPFRNVANGEEVQGGNHKHS